MLTLFTVVSMKTTERMTLLTKRIDVSSRELKEQEDVLNYPNAPLQAKSDAQVRRHFWLRQLRAAQMPLDALDVAYEANGLINQARKAREDVVAIEALMLNKMKTVDAEHPAWSALRHGIGKHESDANHFDKMFVRRTLEAADLFPPIIEVEESESQAVVLAFPAQEATTVPYEQEDEQALEA
jgi:hypothetical protein